MNLSLSPSPFLSLSLFHSLCSLIWHGWRVALEYEDLTDLNNEDKSHVVTTKFQKYWEAEVRRTRYSFIILPNKFQNMCDFFHSAGRPSRDDGYQPISIQDDDDMVRVVSSRQQERRRRSGPSLVLVLVKSFWTIFLAAAGFKFVQDILNFVSPQVLK